MATTTSDLLIDRLLEWDVSMIFGYPGDGNKPKQALHMAEALARGEPNATRIGLTLVRDKVRDYAGK